MKTLLTDNGYVVALYVICAAFSTGFIYFN